jgi:DNA-binding transcriptional ArsR family regulator
MNAAEQSETAAAQIAAAMGEPARARMLYCLMDGRARTSTELALVGGVGPSTASVHLNRLKAHRLVRVLVQGKHRYYSLEGADVASVLERLSVLAGFSTQRFEPSTPSELRSARSCYDHIAGTLGVALHDRLTTVDWLSAPASADGDYDLTPRGEKGFAALGVDVEHTRTLRRRFAFACVDWSERRPHLGGAIGAALLAVALDRKWLRRSRGSRALLVTGIGVRELFARFGVHA